MGVHPSEVYAGLLAMAPGHGSSLKPDTSDRTYIDMMVFGVETEKGAKMWQLVHHCKKLPPVFFHKVPQHKLFMPKKQRKTLKKNIFASIFIYSYLIVLTIFLASLTTCSTNTVRLPIS